MKKIITLLLASSVVFTICLCGCGNSESDSSSQDKPYVLPDEVSIEAEDKFDFNKAKSEFKVEGQAVEFPFLLSQLGDKFSSSMAVLAEDRNAVFGNCDCDYNTAFSFEIHNVDDSDLKLTEDQLIKKYKICSVTQTKENIQESGVLISVSDISIGSSKGEVENTFGIPNEVIHNGNTVSNYNYYSDDSKKCGVLIEFDDDETVSSISIFEK